MRNRLAISILAAALSGCSLAPHYVRPAAPVPPVYQSDAVGRLQAVDLAWREYFTDRRLQRHIEAALSANRDLAVSVARISEARAQYRITEAQRLPQLDLNASGTRTRVPLNAVGFGDALPGTGDDASPTSITFNQFNVGVAVSAFELDLWGRVRNLSEANRRAFLATVEGERAFRLSLISDVASNYLALNAANEQVDLARRTLAARREGLAIAKLRLDAGVTSTIDYDQTVTLVTQAAAQLAELERTAAQTSNFLMVLTGGPISGDLPPPRPIADPGQFEQIDAGLPSSLLINRPDVRAAEQTLIGANASIGAARAAFFPSISLTGQYGFASPQIGNLFKGATQSWSFGGALNLPIFDWGRREANLEQVKAQRDIAVAQYQKTVQTAFREVSDALVGRRRYAEQIAAQVEAVAAQRRLAATAQDRYDNGIELYLQVLDANRSLFQAQQQLIQLRSASLQNSVSLYVALGGGLKGEPVFDGEAWRAAGDARAPMRR